MSAMQEHSRQLEAAKRNAEAASRAKTQFLANASHELRTPLNAIIGFAQILTARGDQTLSGKEAAYAGTILKSARHLLHVVTEILDLSRIEMGRQTLTLERLAVADVVRDAMIECEGIARDRTIKLDVDVAADLPAVHADRLRVTQILSNLVVNGINFTDPGGAVRVDARAAADPADPARRWIRVCVADTGIGVRAQDFERIFLAFEQADPPPARRHEGLGVGLALARRLVELHGGRIWVESDGIPGAGSRFFFTLPVA
jgi:signal transduction histidine kinase